MVDKTFKTKSKATLWLLINIWEIVTYCLKKQKLDKKKKFFKPLKKNTRLSRLKISLFYLEQVPNFLVKIFEKSKTIVITNSQIVQ